MTRTRQIFLIQLGLTAACSAVLLFVAPSQVMAFLAGAGLITLNFALLQWMWAGILDKKSVARTFLIVVIKYAILGAALYIFVKELKLPLIPLFAGMATLVGSFLIAALTLTKGT